ncbi:unnamed protein product [Meloidogyne enterolobii]|uniref:Uncharacterized protein n=1 Tax=Meloidogyne enterolobii TaxID=390850 RepID=A0ACB0ZEU6_MELEN
MFGRRILILLHFSILPFCFASEGKHLAKHLFSDEEIQEDVKAVDLVIQAPWLVKPEAPKQVDLELLAEALDIVVEMNPNEKEVVIRMDKLNEWAKEEKDDNKNKQELDLNLTKSDEKEAKVEDMTLSQLLKLDMEENKEEEESKDEEKEEKQCSEQDKQKFLLNKSIESPIQQQNRTETIFEKINGISGNWWHFAENKQPMEVNTTENKEDKPFGIFGGEKEDVGENEEKEKKEERLQESNENEVFAQIQKGKELRAERPSEMVVVDMNSDEDDSDVESSEEGKIEDKKEAEIEEKEEPMMEIVEIVDLNKENDDEDNDDDNDDEDDNSSTSSEEKIEEEKSTGIFSVLTNLLFGGGRFKREAFPFPAIPNSTKIVEQSDVNSGDNIEKIKIVKSFSGRVKMGDKNVEFSGSKLEITKDLGKEEEKNEEEKREEFLREIFDNDKKIEDLKEEENKIVEKMEELISEEKKMEEENEKTKNVGEKENIKLTEKAKIAKYLTEMLTKTSEDRPKRDEKIAYVWYCELQYWVAKFVEKEFSLKDNKNDSGNVGKVLDEMDVIVEEFEYIRSIWGKILGKLAELTDFIGKEFKRRK